MGIEYRNGRPYYYRKKRKGGKIISEYVGSGELAQIASILDEDDQYEKKVKRQNKQKEEAKYKKLDTELVQFEQIINELFTSVALINGYHKYKRQWRKKRQK